MHTSYYNYTSQIFGRVNTLKFGNASKTLLLVIFEFLNVIIFLYGGY